MRARSGSSRLERSRARVWRKASSTSSKAPSRRQGAREVVLGGAVQAAALVHDDDDLLGAEQPLRRAQRADRVVGREPAGIADDVGVATLEAEHREQVEARVHARQHGHTPPRARTQPGRRQLARAPARGKQHLVRRAAHGSPSRPSSSSTSSELSANATRW
jgi:hypothetical protein